MKPPLEVTNAETIQRLVNCFTFTSHEKGGEGYSFGEPLAGRQKLDEMLIVVATCGFAIPLLRPDGIVFGTRRLCFWR